MTLEKKKRKAISSDPNLMLIYGPPKIGKTTILSQLDNCLIIDTERGANMVEGYIEEVNNREELIELILKAKEGHDYKYCALDTIDKVVEWAEHQVCAEESVRAIADLPFGKGFGLVREKVINTVQTLKAIFPRVIIVGHRKTAKAILEGQAMVEPESLDITGKLKNMLMSACDAIGYVFRNEDEDGNSELMISFKSNGALEAGSRSPHLRGKEMQFNWKHIYKDKESK